MEKILKSESKLKRNTRNTNIAIGFLIVLVMLVLATLYFLLTPV
jgi:hypothetical protein